MPIEFWAFMGVVVALVIVTAMYIRIRDMEGAYYDRRKQ